MSGPLFAQHLSKDVGEAKSRIRRRPIRRPKGGNCEEGAVDRIRAVDDYQPTTRTYFGLGGAGRQKFSPSFGAPQVAASWSLPTIRRLRLTFADHRLALPE